MNRMSLVHRTYRSRRRCFAGAATQPHVRSRPGAIFVATALAVRLCVRALSSVCARRGWAVSPFGFVYKAPGSSPDDGLHPALIRARGSGPARLVASRAVLLFGSKQTPGPPARTVLPS